MPQIVCSDLTVGYGSEAVLKGISFEVNRGDYLCILGENGVGKTTLMKTILGLIRPLSGTLKYDEGAEAIGYLPQMTKVQEDFPASVEEVVLTGCMAAAERKKGGAAGIFGKLFYSAEQKKEAEKVMRETGVYALRKKSFRTLSGGQRQRVLLCRAMLAAGDILLLDEPAAGLDPEASQKMYSLIRHLNSVHGVTILMISHDTAAAERYASHILRLGGEISFSENDLRRAEQAAADSAGECVLPSAAKTGRR